MLFDWHQVFFFCLTGSGTSVSVWTNKPPSTTFKHILVTGVNMELFLRSSVPVVLFDLIPSPRTWISCCTDSVFCWRRRHSKNRARLFPEYLQSGWVISGCCCCCCKQGLTTPTTQVWWNPRRTRTDTDTQVYMMLFYRMRPNPPFVSVDERLLYNPAIRTSQTPWKWAKVTQRFSRTGPTWNGLRIDQKDWRWWMVPVWLQTQANLNSMPNMDTGALHNNDDHIKYWQFAHVHCEVYWHGLPAV